MNKIVFLFLFWNIGETFAQGVAIDRGVLAEGLWCFPRVKDSLTYMYLPNKASLALDERNNPQFSFIRYVNSTLEETLEENTDNQGISKIGGGGVLHFLVSYQTRQDDINKAETFLKQKFGNDKIKIIAPIIFNQGSYTLISSILKDGSQQKEQNMLAHGKAPVLEGSKMAISIEMSPKHSKLLIESFKMPTPDVSVLFDMEFTGLSDAYEAEISVNWSDYYKSNSIDASGSAQIYAVQVSSDVQAEFQDAIKRQAIKLKTSGEDSRMDALMQTVYQKLIAMLYDIVPAEDPDLTSATDIIKEVTKSTLSSLMPYSVNVSYKRKLINRQGTSIINFNSRNELKRHYLLTFNIGNMYLRYGNNINYFKTISLEDEAFQKRDIGVIIDGDLLSEFSTMISTVSVQLRKKHEDNKETIREIKLTKTIVEENKIAPISYGFSNDYDRLKWLEYEYRFLYDFVGGKKYQTEWHTQSNAMINVYVPFERKNISIEGDTQLLRSKQIKAVVIRISYNLFDEKINEQITIKLQDTLQNVSIPLTVSAGSLHYEYKLNYLYNDGTEKQVSGTSISELLFIDNGPF